MSESDWTRRHIAAFRNHRGHSACTVEGCTGSQPPMWVPTETEAWAERQPRGRAVDMAKQAGTALEGVKRRKVHPTLHAGMTGPDGATTMHIHWAV